MVWSPIRADRAANNLLGYMGSCPSRSCQIRCCPIGSTQSPALEAGRLVPINLFGSDVSLASTIRTFVAIELSTDMVDSVERVIDECELASDRYRWSERDQLHLTLNFLGDVQDREIPMVCKRLKAVAEQHAGFDFELKGLEAFPRIDRPRVVWAGLGDGEAELESLQADLEQELRELRFYPDKLKFKAHLTLGKLRRDRSPDPAMATWIEDGAQLRMGRGFVKEVVVFSSFMDRLGPTYTPMARLPLQK